MSDKPVHIATDKASALESLWDDAAYYARASSADNTQRARKADWGQFTSWCNEVGRAALPASAETVALYLTHLARDRKTSTIARHFSTIRLLHQRQGGENPTNHPVVRDVMSGIRREKGTHQAGKKPVMGETLRTMLEGLPDSTLGIRDRALLLLGFAGAMRRSEIVALDLLHIERTDDGLVIFIAGGKTDQEKTGRKIGIPFGSRAETCPVRSIEAWLQVLGEGEGPLFRAIDNRGQIAKTRLSDRTVARVVKRALAEVGIENADFSGHSLRAGLATEAARGGASERVIQAQTGHKSLSVLRRYIRDGNLFRENAVTFTNI